MRWQNTAVYFYPTRTDAIPVPGIVGTIVGIATGLGVHYDAKNIENYQLWLSLFLSFATSFLSVGFFVGGCHRIRTKKVRTNWQIIL